MNRGTAFWKRRKVEYRDNSPHPLITWPLYNTHPSTTLSQYLQHAPLHHPLTVPLYNPHPSTTLSQYRSTTHTPLPPSHSTALQHAPLHHPLTAPTTRTPPPPSYLGKAYPEGVVDPPNWPGLLGTGSLIQGGCRPLPTLPGLDSPPFLTRSQWTTCLVGNRLEIG